MRRRPRVLTVAGSDSGGGAGIQADLKTFAARGVYGASVVTALTAQNTRGVHGVHPVPTDFVRLQLRCVLDDIGADAVKTGMLPTPEIVRCVAEQLAAAGSRPRSSARAVAVDPVMVAKGGDALTTDAATDELKARLLPLTTVVTPNIPEAEVLLRGADGPSARARRVESVEDMRACARELYACLGGACAVLLKGGHRGGAGDESSAPRTQDEDVCVDVLYNGGAAEEVFCKPRVHTRNTHGTGCTTASAVAAELAKGAALRDAVRDAKAYVHGCIEHALALGSGHGPLDHFYFL